MRSAWVVLALTTMLLVLLASCALAGPPKMMTITGTAYALEKAPPPSQAVPFAAALKQDTPADVGLMTLVTAPTAAQKMGAKQSAEDAYLMTKMTTVAADPDVGRATSLTLMQAAAVVPRVPDALTTTGIRQITEQAASPATRHVWASVAYTFTADYTRTALWKTAATQAPLGVVTDKWRGAVAHLS